jgi:DNA repair photolyase
MGSEPKRSRAGTARPRGRGASRNVKSRFDRFETVLFDDGDHPGFEDETESPPTVLTADNARTIIATNDSPDVPFSQSINPYRGCEHGCVYCFARPSHAYLDLSPGLDFETRILYKPNAPELLRHELTKDGYRCSPLAMGTNTDPYQPAERRLRLTRSIIEVLSEHRHPISIVTKSDLVTRDLDLLAPLARENLTSVFFSITTLDAKLARTMEPRASTPRRRLEAMARVAGAGVPTGVLASPMIPGLNDTELENILEASAAAAAVTAGYILLRLPHEVKILFTEWLERQYPTRAEKILNRLREMRGGDLNDPRFEARQTGEGSHAALLRRRFEIACRRLGLGLERPRLDCSRFRVPGRPGPQLRLFG